MLFGIFTSLHPFPPLSLLKLLVRTLPHATSAAILILAWIQNQWEKLMAFYGAPLCLTESKQGQVKSRVFPYYLHCLPTMVTALFWYVINMYQGNETSATDRQWIIIAKMINTMNTTKIIGFV